MTTLIERDLTARQVARMLGMSDRRARELLRSGAVPTVYETEGGQLRVAPSGIARWVEERGK